MTAEETTSVKTHAALEVDGDGAAAFLAAHPTWYIFPGEIYSDGDGGWGKRPAMLTDGSGHRVQWTSSATNDPDEARALWKRVGGTGVVCVACAPSGIWVLDQDSELDPVEHSLWIDILDTITITKATLILSSVSRANPHYVFAQGSEWVAEGKWPGGEVKSSGMVMVSKTAPIVDAPVSVAPKALLDRLRIGRPKGSRGRGVSSSEEMYEWLDTTPDVDDLILDAKGAEHFLNVIVEHMVDEVEAGAHRRQACLNAVFQAAIEASAGCYPADAAYKEIRDAYRNLRESKGEGGDKGWSKMRARDYEMMWASLVPAMKAGDYDDKIAETRSAAWERYGGDPDEMRNLIEAIISGEGLATIEAPEAGLSAPPTPPEGIDPATGEVLVKVREPELDWDAVGATAIPEPPKLAKLAVGRPELHEDALWGPHGELIDALRGRHESADIGVLGALIAYSGVFLAGRAHFRIGVDYHGPNDYIVNIGASSSARKSSALHLVERGVFYEQERLDDAGALAIALMPRKVSGVASGERYIHLWVPVKDGEDEIWPERRVMLVESEASALWKRARRDGAVLSDVVCKMWDQTTIANHAITSGSVSVPSDKHLAGFIGASTTHVAIESMRSKDGSDAHSGFANRFLWFFLPDSGIDLPFGAPLPKGAIRKYQDRIDIFRPDSGGFGVEADWSDGARTMWETTYSVIKRDKGAAGFIEAMCSRAESHVVRVALNYWLAAGGDPREVGVDALKAALAVWQYAKDSVEYIFGDSTGDRETDNLVAELESRGGWATMEELRADLNKNTLAGLVRRGIEAGVIIQGRLKSVGGRPPKAVALASWKAAGKLASTSSGVGKTGSPKPVADVVWET